MRIPRTARTPLLLAIAALLIGCSQDGEVDSKQLHIVKVEIAENGCPIMPEPPYAKDGDTVRIRIDHDDSDALQVKKWAIAFTEGNLNCGCEQNQPQHDFVCQVPDLGGEPAEFCYSIATKMSDTNYCELDPTIFVNRSAASMTDGCQDSKAILTEQQPTLGCTPPDLAPGTW